MRPASTSYRTIPLLSLFAVTVLSLPCIKADAQHPQGTLAEAQALESRGEYQEAVLKYQAALKASPSSREARLGAGRTLGKLGKCGESKTVLTSLSASASAEVEPILGACYFSLHDFDQAIAHLKLARAAAPQNQQVYLNLARAYSSAGRDREAIATLKAWLARHPQDPDALYWMGRIYDSMSQNVLEQMTAKDPNNYLVHELEGDQLRLKQDYPKALAAYQAALTANPDAPGLHFNVGDIYYRTLRYPEASEELAKELKINPYHSRANFELGDIQIKQGRVEEGMPFLERALKLDASLGEAHRSLARGLLAQKRYPEAVREIQWLIKSDPADHTAHAMLSGAYRQMGRMQEAQEEAEISQKLLQEHATRLENLKTEEQQMNDQPPAPSPRP